MRLLALVIAAAMVAACGEEGTVPEIVKVDGSSTVFPISEAVAEEFQAASQGRYRVTVGMSGSGGGFKKFCRGDTDISNASRPIRTSEIELCRENGIEFIELPVALDALSVVVNPENDWVDYLTVEELKKIWEPAAQGEIDAWSQVRGSFPDRPLSLYGAGADSGTYDYFTEAVVGEEHSSRGDYTASEDDNVIVMGVATDHNALGFFGLAYLAENRGKLKPVPISYQGGEPVLPSVETAKDGSYQPLSRPLFIYVNRARADQSPAVRSFVETYLDPTVAPNLAREVGYVPLPGEAYELALTNFENRVLGTAFGGGSKVGVSIEDLLRAERSR